MTNSNSPFSDSSAFNAFNAQLQTSALKSVKNALGLPSDLSFHRSMDAQFAKDLDRVSSRALSLTNKLLALAPADENGKLKGKRRRLDSEEDVLDSFQSIVVDSMDQLLEKTDTCIDQILGHLKAPAIAVKPIKDKLHKSKAVVPNGKLDPALRHAFHLPKPQLLFETKPDNTNPAVWKTSLKHKYNAQVPLNHVYRDLEDEGNLQMATFHPYRYEIKNIQYPAHMFQPHAPIPPKSFAETPFSWVSTPEGLSLLLEKLRYATEIAIDLEHHSYRTFAGFLCLMQISTREEDFIIDTLALREELTELNEIFTDPNKVKVFHGAQSDIVWLQQDFNLYIVNLFDTYHASKVLDFPRHGLASLLEMYCDFTPDKKYQLADWRIRPLPEEMLDYARSDTHFLLYIYDNLRNALIDRSHSRAQSPNPDRDASNELSPSKSTLMKSVVDPSHILLRRVLECSEDTALKTYEKEPYDAELGLGSSGWSTLAWKWNKSALLVPGTPKRVFCAIHAWRDRVARESDESIVYVLANHHLIRLAESPPANINALLSSFHPVPPLVRQNLKQLFDVIRAAIDAHQESVAELGVASKMEVEVVSDVQDQDAAMKDESALWRSKAQPATVATNKSALFGESLSSSQKEAATTISSYRASDSLLFGEVNLDAKASAATRNAHFRELLERIHSNLVIVPKVPKPELVPRAEQEPEVENPTGMQIEVPFVPASQRKAASQNIVADDSIVVVGQARQRKRKRAKGAANGPEEKSEVGGLETKIEEGIKTFDFSSVPNILDAQPAVEVEHAEGGKERRKKKQRQGKDSVYEHGNFPAPPRAYREVQSGNQSHTFK